MWKIYTKMENAILPDMVNPQSAYRNVLRKCINKNTKWLDLGCGHKIYSNYLPESEKTQHEMVQKCKYVFGIDGDQYAIARNQRIPNKVLGDIHELPFDNQTFNLITANMVVEHAEDPTKLLAEIDRVLEPGGLFVFHTPNLKSYKIILAKAVPDNLKKIIIKLLQDRAEADVFSTHYKLNTPKTIRTVAETYNYELSDLHLLQAPADSVMLGPIVAIELLLMKILSYNALKTCRSNIIAVLKKKDAALV